MRAHRRPNRTILLLTLIALAAHSAALLGVLPGALPSTGDTVGAFVPWHEFTRYSLWSRGEIPLWNPHLFCGMPFLGNGQSGLLYPPNYLHFLLPENLALWLFAFGHSAFLMVGTYFLGRTLGLRRRSSFLAAVLFGLGNATPAHLFGGHLTFLPVRSYWPWEAAFLLRLLRGRSARDAVALAACLTLGLAAGAPQMWIFGLLFCVGVFAAWALSSRTKIAKVIPYLALTGLLALLWSAPTLLPLRELKEWSSHGQRLTFAEVTDLAATPLSLLRLFLNGFFGGNSFVMWSLRSNPGEDAASIGLAPFLLALAAPWLARGSRTVRWLAVGCLVALVLALGASTPLYRVLYDYVFLFQITRVPARWLELWAFGAALLCGYSFDALLRRPGRARIMQWAWWVGIGVTGLLLGASLLLQAPWQHGARVVQRALQLPDGRLPELAASLQSDAVVTCVLAGATLILLARVWGRGLTKNSRVALVIGLLAAEPLMQFWLSTRITPAEAARENQVPASIAGKYEKGSRWIVRAPFSQMNAPFRAGIDAINGYEPFGSAQFYEFALAADGKSRFSADFQPRRMDSLWRVAGATHLLWKPRFAKDSLQGFRGKPILQDGKWHLLELEDGLSPWPRAYLTANAVRVPEAKGYDVLEQLSAKHWSGAMPVVVEPEFPKVVGTSLVLPAVEPRTLSADVLMWSVTAPQDAVFVHQEAIAPGWRAYVDGRPTGLHRVNGFFRGVPVPRGARQVSLVYDSQTLRFALFMAFCGAGFAVSAFTAARGRGPKQRP